MDPRMKALPTRIGGGKVRVTCPRHGEWVFPHPSTEAGAFARDHADCEAVDPLLLRQPGVRSKSRRAPLVHLIQQRATAPAADDDGGRSAPSHMGATLGFAPPARRDWRSPGPVRL
jgi:hypothetical protein